MGHLQTTHVKKIVQRGSYEGRPGTSEDGNPVGENLPVHEAHCPRTPYHSCNFPSLLHLQQSQPCPLSLSQTDDSNLRRPNRGIRQTLMSPRGAQMHYLVLRWLWTCITKRHENDYTTPTGGTFC
jgi:hypothetical protein